MILKLIIIISILIIGIWLIKARKNTRVRAWQKLLFLIFILSVIALTLFPNFALEIAIFLGLTRVTDLIVYGTILIFLFVTVNIYLKFQEVQSQMSRLARKIAIQEGLLKNPDWEKEI